MLQQSSSPNCVRRTEKHVKVVSLHRYCNPHKWILFVTTLCNQASEQYWNFGRKIRDESRFLSVDESHDFLFVGKNTRASHLLSVGKIPQHAGFRKFKFGFFSVYSTLSPQTLNLHYIKPKTP